MHYPSSTNLLSTEGTFLPFGTKLTCNSSAHSSFSTSSKVQGVEGARTAQDPLLTEVERESYKITVSFSLFFTQHKPMVMKAMSDNGELL